jgi:anti-sigma-K factor RskA
VFSVDPSGAGSLSVRPLPGVASVDAFAVTLEPAGGLPAPSGAMYLLGKS